VFRATPPGAAQPIWPRLDGDNGWEAVACRPRACKHTLMANHTFLWAGAAPRLRVQFGPFLGYHALLAVLAASPYRMTISSEYSKGEHVA